MDNFENQLKQISLRKPSAQLRQRIFNEEIRSSEFTGFLARRIPLGWAALFALLVGLAGYALAYLTRPQANLSASLTASTVDVQIVETGTDRNFFDFSHPSGDMLPGELIATVELNEEV